MLIVMQLNHAPTQTYDIIVVLGNGFADNWQNPPHVEERLRIVTDLYRNGITNKIGLTGKWSRNWEIQGITPPVKEAELMEDFLLTQGIPQEDIHLETSSMDTIGNAYFTKRDILIPHNYKNILLLCADYNAERTDYIFSRILGEEYHVSVWGTPTDLGEDTEVRRSVQSVFDRQKAFLDTMPPGDHTYLDNLYSKDFYNYKDQDTSAYIAMGRKR